MSDERATFKYTGPDQSIRVGAETFHRFIDTLVTDPDTIAEVRKLPDFSEEGAAGWTAPADEPEPVIEAEAPKAPTPAPAPQPAPATATAPATAPKPEEAPAAK